MGWGGISKEEKQGHAAGYSQTAQALLGMGWRDGGDGAGFREREGLSGGGGWVEGCGCSEWAWLERGAQWEKGSVKWGRLKDRMGLSEFLISFHKISASESSFCLAVSKSPYLCKTGAILTVPPCCPPFTSHSPASQRGPSQGQENSFPPPPPSSCSPCLLIVRYIHFPEAEEEEDLKARGSPRTF